MKDHFLVLNFKKIPIAFLCAAIVLIVVQSALMKTRGFWKVCYAHTKPIADDGLRLRSQLEMINNVHENKRIFLTGSSQTREGFDVNFLDGNFKDGSAVFFNFGISGSGQPIEIFMIEDSLIKKNPDIIVYMPFVGSFYSEYSFDKMKYYFSFKIVPYMLKYLGIKEMMLYKNAFMESCAGKLSFLYKYRNSFKKTRRGLLETFFCRGEKQKFKKFAYHENKSPEYFQNCIRESNGNRYKKTKYTDINMELFKVVAADLDFKKIKFIVIEAPVHPLMKKNYKNKLNIEYISFLKKQADEFGFVFLQKKDMPQFRAEDFVDFLHLNEKGRRKMGEFFTGYLKNEVFFQ